MSENTFLVEIGTEELPPKALRSLAESFAANVTAELDNAGRKHRSAAAEHDCQLAGEATDPETDALGRV